MEHIELLLSFKVFDNETEKGDDYQRIKKWSMHRMFYAFNIIFTSTSMYALTTELQEVLVLDLGRKVLERSRQGE